MRLYGKGMSRSFRCVWAAEEAGVDYEYVSVEFGSDQENGTASEGYRALNTQGKVPTLVVENGGENDSEHALVLCESAAIVNYLAMIVPDKQLIPSDSQLALRAQYDQLAFFALSDLEQPLWTHGKHKFAIPKEHRVPDVIKTTYWEFEKSQKALLNLLSNTDGFALPNGFSMVDVLLAHTLSWAESFKYELLPELKAYKERMYERPACQRAVKKVTA